MPAGPAILIFCVELVATLQRTSRNVKTSVTPPLVAEAWTLIFQEELNAT